MERLWIKIPKISKVSYLKTIVRKYKKIYTDAVVIDKSTLLFSRTVISFTRYKHVGLDSV